MTDENFQAYELGPDEGGYDDEGGYEEPYEDEGGYDEDILEQLGVVDEYGQVDEDRLAEIVERTHGVHQQQVGIAQAQQDRALEQTAYDLRAATPSCRRSQAFTRCSTRRRSSWATRATRRTCSST